MSAGQVRLREIQKVYSEWCVQAAEIILAARVDHPRPTGTPQQTSASFNLKVPELFNVRNEAVARAEFFQLRTQRSFQVEIYVSGEDEEGTGEEAGQLLERWTFTYLPAAAQPDPTAQLDRHNQTLVRRLSVVLRTLLFFVRLLPAHGLCRSARSGDPAGQPPPARYHRFRVEAWPPTSRMPAVQELVSQDFVTLPSTAGSLRLSVAQRKDLKCLSSSGPLKGVAAISSQMDTIDMEEGFFAQTSSAAGSGVSADAARSKLDKIAEEPEVRQGEVAKLQPGGLAEGAQSQSTAAPFEPNVRVQGPDRPESPAQSASTSSRAASTSVPAVVLDATPPLAAAGAALPTHPLSLSSSRSHTPLPTPCSTPNQEPAAEPTSGGAVGINAERHSVAIEDKSLKTPSGELDDLSNIWMSSLPDWGRRRSMSLDGSRGTGGTSRSVSPEDPSRGPSMGDLQSSGRMARGSAASVSSGTARYPPESEGEICLFGMSDDEEEKMPSDEDDVERNVVASAIVEGGGGGAFATASTRIDVSKLGLADLESDQPGLSRRSSQASPRQRFSPLIAQLNPFQPPPSLDLPPGHAAAQSPPALDAAGPEEDGVSSGVAKADDVGLLVEQMGDLVCRLQQRQDLAIFSEETYPEELLRRLDHFREVAKGLAAN